MSRIQDRVVLRSSGKFGWLELLLFENERLFLLIVGFERQVPGVYVGREFTLGQQQILLLTIRSGDSHGGNFEFRAVLPPAHASNI